MLAGLAMTLLLSCAGPPEPAKQPAKVAPSSVTQPRAESDLTTLRLTPQAVERLGVETEPIRFEELRRPRSLAGMALEPAGESFEITAPLAGYLKATRSLEPGQAVSAEQELFQLAPLEPGLRGTDPRPEAQRQLDVAEARLREAGRRLARSQRLLADGAGSQKGVEQAETEVELAEADRKAAQGQLEFLVQNPIEEGSGLTIVSPRSGTIRELLASGGQVVAAGAVLARVARYDPIWVQVSVYSGELDEIDRTATARVKPLGGGETSWSRSARPVLAPPSADPDSSSVHLYYSLPNPDLRLRPGERVEVELPSREQISVLTVPWSAVVRDPYGGQWVYESPEPGLFIRRRVEVCWVEQTRAVICQGPGEGTTIVSVGAAELLGAEFGVGK